MSNFDTFIFIFIIANLLWFALYKFRNQFNLLFIVGLAVSAWSISFYTGPTHENDFYRYFFDGHQVLSGANPYLVAPENQELLSALNLETLLQYPAVKTDNSSSFPKFS